MTKEEIKQLRTVAQWCHRQAQEWREHTHREENDFQERYFLMMKNLIAKAANELEPYATEEDYERDEVVFISKQEAHDGHR